MNAPDHQLVARLVAELADRTDAQGSELAAALAARWSPPDRHEPLALEWLHRWSSRPAYLPSASCTCVTGSCLICN